MITVIEIFSKKFTADLDEPIDISIPLVPGGTNPNCYYADNISSEIIRSGNFIGSVLEGGSVNHKKITFTPHGNGTHTECYGHLSKDTITLNDCLTRFHFTALLISVEPETHQNDKVITLEQVKEKLPEFPVQAVIIRTLPNDNSKKSKQYSGTNPPYLEAAVTAYLAEIKVLHLLVDLPSVDREEDEGKLAAHKAFWKMPDTIRRDCTITELVYVDPVVPDGLYLLNLQVTSLASDASPSKPVLFKLREVS